jgi:hypothetical protein
MKLSREKNLRKASPSPFVFCNQSLLSDLFIITGSRFFFFLGRQQNHHHHSSAKMMGASLRGVERDLKLDGFIQLVTH